MNYKNKLTISIGLLYLFVILSFGLIIINEKKDIILKPKIEKKFNDYLESNYKEEFIKSSIRKDNNKYYIKVMNKKNIHLYFIVYLKDKKIKDTYKKDYLEGKTLNTYIEKLKNKNIKSNKYDSYKIKYNVKLNECTKYVKDKLISGYYDLPIYTIKVEDNYNNINTKLKDIYLYTSSLNLKPKDYDITLNNKENINKSINIKINNDILKSSTDIESLILNNDQSTLNKLNIKIEYLN